MSWYPCCCPSEPPPPPCTYECCDACEDTNEGPGGSNRKLSYTFRINAPSIVNGASCTGGLSCATAYDQKTSYVTRLVAVSNCYFQVPGYLLAPCGLFAGTFVQLEFIHTASPLNNKIRLTLLINVGAPSGQEGKVIWEKDYGTTLIPCLELACVELSFVSADSYAIAYCDGWSDSSITVESQLCTASSTTSDSPSTSGDTADTAAGVGVGIILPTSTVTAYDAAVIYDYEILLDGIQASSTTSADSAAVTLSYDTEGLQATGTSTAYDADVTVGVNATQATITSTAYTATLSGCITTCDYVCQPTDNWTLQSDNCEEGCICVEPTIPCNEAFGYGNTKTTQCEPSP